MFPITIYDSQFIFWHIENFVSVCVVCDWWRMRNAPDIPKPHTLCLPACLPQAVCVNLCAPLLF